jgi:hypothetical protein
MEKVQSNLFRDNETEIPNIYFDINIENSYSKNEVKTNELNPNKIKDICKNDKFDNTNGLDATYDNSTVDSEYNNYINNNKNYNNFIYKYITNQGATDTSLNNIVDDNQKNQLKYLTCELLKIKNKKFDTNNFILNNTSSFLSEDTISKVLLGFSILIVIYILISFIYKISNDKSLFFDKFKGLWGIFGDKMNTKVINFIFYLLIITVILVGIIGFFNKNSQNLSNNDKSSILFYEKEVVDDNYKSVIEGTRIYFILSFVLIFVLYYILQIFIPKGNDKIYYKTNIGIYICSFIILVITICTVLVLNTYDNQINLTTDNLYNTGKNIYQNIINGIKENFGYISLLLGLSIISYILVLFMPSSLISSSNIFAKFFIILFSSFGYFMPLFIIFFEFSFAILYSTYFILSIILFRVVFYMISYIIKVININRKFSVEFLSVLFEYPTEYFEKLFQRDTIQQDDFPKNNPSGMPWNLSSINIIKLLVFIARTIFNKDGTITDYFTRTLN